MGFRASLALLRTAPARLGSGKNSLFAQASDWAPPQMQNTPHPMKNPAIIPLRQHSRLLASLGFRSLESQFLNQVFPGCLGSKLQRSYKWNRTPEA
uniref:Coenzyme A synthase n=1 Tax=Molossus molossus TaxID=27622 RepID=A0A7J8CWU6_MOLMO|nr:Coenzyme A synthase [Molossus molossus]